MTILFIFIVWPLSYELKGVGSIIFGEGESSERFWPSLRNAAKTGKNFKMTGGLQIRDFTPVVTVARQIINLALKGKLIQSNPIIYNLGTGTPQRLKDFAEYWWKKFGANGKLLFDNIPYRTNEVMRYVPRVNKIILDLS